jgi:outer membrane lipoprotein SlyB
LIRLHLLPILLLAGLSGCGPSYSPDTYATNAVQQANKAEQGVIVGVRAVAVSAAGTVGAVTGAAAGGIAGSQVGVGTVNAFSALGGSLVGGLAGSAVEHATSDTTAFEYIVRKSNNELVSVTQKDKVPLALGEKVLVIGGNQARVVPDYTVAITDKPTDAAKTTDAAKPAQAEARSPAEPPAPPAPPASSAASTPPPPAAEAPTPPADAGTSKSASPALEARPTAAS